jgi:hypothetical protein
VAGGQVRLGEARVGGQLAAGAGAGAGHCCLSNSTTKKHNLPTNRSKTKK